MTSVDDNETVQIRPDPDKLFVYHRQQLSAMLDGELSPDEAKFMLRRLQHDQELAACWERWQVCGDVLRGQRNDLLPADFAQRVAVAVGAGTRTSTAQASTQRPARPRLLRWGGGAAVAASVALMAVFVGRQFPDADTQPATAPAPVVAEAAPTQQPQPDPRAATPAPVAETPSPLAQPELALAAAAAAAEVPRRAAQRRAVRGESRSRVAEAAQAPALAAVASEPLPDLFPESTVASSEAFAMPQATARPWPRALMAPQDGFTVSSGGLLPRQPQFEPLLPGARMPPWPAPAQAEPQRGERVLH